MKFRELSQDEIDAVSGGTARGSLISTGPANGGNGGNGGSGNFAVSALSGNSVSVGLLTFGQRTGNGSNGNAVGGGNGGSGGSGGNTGFALFV